jgi:hypothetical protein
MVRYWFINSAIFGKRLRTQYVCLGFSTNLSKAILNPRRTERDMVKNVYWYARKVPLLLSDFNENRFFSKNFWKKKIQYPTSIEFVH